MVHRKRKYEFREISSAEELADELTRSIWCLCAGFSLDGYPFLNDLFTGDGAQ